MKVLMIKGFLATRSSASKSCLSLLEPAVTRLPPCQSCLEAQADEIVAKTYFVSCTFMVLEPLTRLDGSSE
jgi:hypothetical protein